ncbi:MAG TPA: LLM class F420-dependent oxidoreductase [Steroidobacteraceae bacterium]|nr:LLM class F420-dependent oxidoreductase [Steroidobacteraceae bacterium]
MKITIGAMIIPQNGTLANLKRAWVGAEALGADRVYVSDHFFTPSQADMVAAHRRAGDIAERDAGQVRISVPEDADSPIFESMTLQAAMAVTTMRAEIGCLVCASAYRNPNLLADMARTIDHLSGGRYVLGIGAGWHRRDFDEYGYVFGTTGSRLRNLEHDIETIRARWKKLNPPPTRAIRIIFGGGGEKVSLRIAAQHANEWHYVGTPEALARKAAVLDQWCVKIGRDPREITRCTSVGHGLEGAAAAEDYVGLGFSHLIASCTGPDWDLSAIKNLVAWRDARK